MSWQLQLRRSGSLRTNWYSAVARTGRMASTTDGTEYADAPLKSVSSSATKSTSIWHTLRRLAENRLLIIAAVFVLAFAVRLGHNISLEHRVWFLEDAQNYLRSGNSINQMIKSSHSPLELCQNISKDATQYSGMYQAFNSDKLVDRMLTDGAVFPIYLSAVLNASGFRQESFQYEKVALPISIANSLLDATTCVLICLIGFLCFGTLPGALAGLLYGLYPAAIVNTQWCMSETFVTFMLVASVYSLARFVMIPAKATTRKTIAGIATGIVLGLTVLSRSAFPFVLPFLALAAIAGSRKNDLELVRNENKSRSMFSKLSVARVVPALSIATAFAITVSPWLWYTQTALGKPRLTTNRLPAFNAISGNLPSTDGWSPYPTKIAFPEEMGPAINMVIADAQAHPSGFLLLQMKKLARLWSAVWNDCKYSIMGLNSQAQNVYHQLMLFLALGWAFIACSRGRANLSKGEYLGTALTSATIAAHFVYMAFIALSRYALTAMPFVILAAGAGLSYWLQAGKQARIRYSIIALCFCVIATVVNEFRVLSSHLVGLLPQPIGTTLAPLLLTVVAIAAYAALWVASMLMLRRFIDIKFRPILLSLCAVSFTTVACGITGSIIGSRVWSEWSTELKKQQTISQTIALPGQLGTLGDTGFVAMDIFSPDSLPEVTVELNGTVLKEQALPIHMVQMDTDSIVQSLAVQAKVMDLDYRTFRTWYIVPFSTSLLRPGQDNVIRLRNNAADTTITLYGDYVPTAKGENDGSQILPSINSTSWNYAVEGADFRVPVEQRPLENIFVHGKTTASSFQQEGGRAEGNDLSPSSSGNQWGSYRVRLMLQPLSKNQIARAAAASQVSSTQQNNLDSNVVVFAQKDGEVCTAHGGDPSTFYLTKDPVVVSEDLLARHPIKFTCELKTEKRPVTAFANLIFKTGNGDVWTPTWQPGSIPVDAKAWRRITVIDWFPKKLLQHGGITTQPVLTPFGDDLLFNNQKKASKQSVQFRNAKLEVLATEIPSPRDFFSWKIF
jgi:hypothetical protein